VAATFFGKPETLMEGDRPVEFENPAVASHPLWRLFSFQMSAFSFDDYEVRLERRASGGSAQRDLSEAVAPTALDTVANF
jgi:hypothetical protein